MMTRQQRRAQERETRKRAVRQTWNDGMAEVHRAAEGGVFLNYILIGHEQIEHVARAAIAGDPTGDALIETIAEWLWAAAERDPILPQLCLACETQFGPGHAAPRGFAIALSFNNAASICTGICAACCERDRDELSHVLFDWQRKLFPEARVVSGQWGCA
jgi:hypothetical protein